MRRDSGKNLEMYYLTKRQYYRGVQTNKTFFLLARKRRHRAEAESTFLQESYIKESTIGDRAEETPRENRAEHREQGRRDTSWTGTRKRKVLEAEGGP